MSVSYSYKWAKRIAVTLVGVSVLLVGVVMLIAPGPAFIVIPAGLAILSMEFAWARQWLARLRRSISRQQAEVRAARAESHRASD